MDAMEKRSTVAVVSVRTTVQETVREAMELASFQSHLLKDKPTALKVNLGWDLFIPGSITSPWVIEGVIQTLREWTGQLFLVESDQVLENIEKAFLKSRLHELCDKYGVKWVNMTGSEMVQLPVKDGRIFQQIQIPKILTECQLVTIPVMKTHAKTQLSGAIKNQWGCISKMRHNYHLVLNDALADINSVLRPSFAVCDATIALEGNGPKSGHPKIVNRVLASRDIVAIDTIQAKLMGIDPSRVDHLQSCSDRCIGTNQLDQIEILGDDDASSVQLNFQRAQHNLVSRVEEFLRRSRLKKLVFDTPIFLIMLIGAKLWYLIWFYLVSGKRHWKRILEHPFYGPEWRRISGE
jgi:uncharacterized protein (DUF362 family)